MNSRPLNHNYFAQYIDLILSSGIDLSTVSKNTGIAHKTISRLYKSQTDETDFSQFAAIVRFYQSHVKQTGGSHYV